VWGLVFDMLCETVEGGDGEWWWGTVGGVAIVVDMCPVLMYYCYESAKIVRLISLSK
jgi:hypothetical protein